VIPLLSGLEVLDLSSGIPGAYATKLFADLGAHITKLEHREDVGHPRRGTALHRHLTAGKEVLSDVSDGGLAELIARSDMVVESGTVSSIEPDDLLRRHPHLVLLSLTPYGRTGPWRDHPATEFTVQAAAGCTARRGSPQQSPMQIGGGLLEWATGTFGAVGAMAALHDVRRSGQGSHVDASMLLAAAYATSGQLDVAHLLAGRPTITDVARSVQMPSIEPAADGWVGFVLHTRQQFTDFALMIGQPEMADSDEWASARYRELHADEWSARVHAWTTAHTTAEIIELATLMRIPVAPVNDARGVVASDQVVARGLLTKAAVTEPLRPAVPFVFDGARVPLSAWGTSTEGQIASTRQPPQQLTAPCDVIQPSLPPPGRPLEGLRILDATAFWAGPCASQVLAYLGAEVIHLESVRRPDGGRYLLLGAPAVGDFWERGPLWLSNNVDKASLTLSLDTAAGVALFRRLVTRCDVVMENFSPRVFDTFGISADLVREANPEALFVRMPAFGLDGPWRDRVGFAATMEQVAGLAWLTGDPSGPPVVPRGICDPVAGHHAVFAILAALWARSEGPKIHMAEVAMLDSALNIAAESLLAFTAEGTIQIRSGNRSARHAPQGLYACAGVERWLALSVVTDEHWRSFTRVLGDPDLMHDEGLKTVDGRLRNEDRIDEQLVTLLRARDLDEIVGRLLKEDVPAACVVDPRTLVDHPQLRELGFYEAVTHPVVGELAMPTMPFASSVVRRWSRGAAPLLGQHNERLLKGLLGVTDDEYAALVETSVVGNRPLNA
jgi:crotonobetainyl-CoA:carnitine CoA-transferase CaiB-like acyl-CoA transferase